MEVAASRLLEIPVLAISGEIDHDDAFSFSAAIEGCLVQGKNVLMLDLTDVTYIDSGGLSVLLSAVRQLRRDGWLGVINPNVHVRRLLEIVGLTIDTGLRIFADRDEAGRVLAEMAGPETAG